MDLIGKSVKHKVFGKGVIVDYNDGRIAMEFAKGKKIFTYPDAFENFLSTDDAELSSKVVADLKLKNEEVLQIQSEKEEKIALEEAQKAEIKVKKPRAKAKSYPRANIAFRCRYAEGGQSANQIPKEWRSLAGVVKSGVNEGKVTKLHQVQMNSLCALTARDAGTDESERFIFTVFMINEAIDATTKESYITTDSKYRISLTPTEARQNAVLEVSCFREQ